MNAYELVDAVISRSPPSNGRAPNVGEVMLTGVLAAIDPDVHPERDMVRRPVRFIVELHGDLSGDWTPEVERIGGDITRGLAAVAGTAGWFRSATGETRTEPELVELLEDEGRYWAKNAMCECAEFIMQRDRVGRA